MNTKLGYQFLLACLLASAMGLSASAQGTAFSYQGRLMESGGPVNGSNDFTFTLYDAASGGATVGVSNVVNDLAVTNGLFTTALDFGAAAFSGSDRWLEIGVRLGTNAGAYTPLTPRQRITSTPYAIRAANLTGPLPLAQLPAGVVTNNSTGVLLAGTFTGNGTGLSNVNAATLAGLSSAGFWKTNGNAGANPANGAFLGTTDNLPVEFRVNGSRMLRLEPAAPGVISSILAPNVIGGWAGNQVTNGAIGATVWGGGFDLGGDYGNIVGADFGTVSGGRQNSAGGAEATVAGGRANRASGGNATISGGYANTATGNSGTVSGGTGNTASSDSSTVSGGVQNTIQTGATDTTIGGGAFNTISSNSYRGTVGGGFANTVGAPEGTVAGGAFNNALGFSATIGGGGGNAVSGAWSAIVGGRDNLLTNSDYAAIGGGVQNSIQTNAPYSNIGGGAFNVVQSNAYRGTVGGGWVNTVGAPEGTVAGGAFNNSLGFSATIGGGGGNMASGEWSTIAGGRDNRLTNSQYATIGGGLQNAIQSNGFAATIGGGVVNTIQVDTFGSTLGGGRYNTIEIAAVDATLGGGIQNIIQSNAFSATIGGGAFHTVRSNAWYGTVGGGYVNTIGMPEGTVAGGAFNSALGFSATIGGGGGNAASGDWSTIAGGRDNQLSNAPYASIGGGVQNTIQSNGFAATIPGGWLNSATDFAFAAGRRAKANHTGAFVWADATDADFLSASTNQFNVRASGGVRMETGGAGMTLDGVNVISGVVPSASLAGTYSGAVVFNNSGNSFTGNGANLTALNASQLASGTVPDARMSANVSLLGSSIDSAEITDGTIAPVDLNLTAFNTTFWRTTGNAGTTPGTQFLGTTDNQPLEFKVWGLRALRLESFGNSPNVIGGYSLNVVSNGFIGATIAGGGSSDAPNRIGGDYGTVPGGYGNTAIGRASIAMGFNTTARGSFSTAAGADTIAIGLSSIAMGNTTTASGDRSVALGSDNVASGLRATALGTGTTASGDSATALGSGSTASGERSTAFGFVTQASGGYSTAMGYGASTPGFGATAMGRQTVAAGDYSFAAGYLAKANHHGSFVWADSIGADFVSTDMNQFVVRASSGVGLGTGNPQGSLHVYSANNPTVLRLQSSAQPGAGRVEFVSDPQGSANEWRPGFIQSTDNGGFTGGLAFFVNGTGAGSKFGELETMRIVNGRVGIGTATPSSALQVVGTVTAMAFNPPSDRNLKENFSPVSPRDVLDKVTSLPISRWNFKGDAATPHVGPMAQDFHAAFGLGTDERHIATVDADGVALAAIQGLNQKVEEQSAALKSKDARIAELEKRLVAIEILLQK